MVRSLTLERGSARNADAEGNKSREKEKMFKWVVSPVMSCTV